MAKTSKSTKTAKAPKAAKAQKLTKKQKLMIDSPPPVVKRAPSSKPKAKAPAPIDAGARRAPHISDDILIMMDKASEHAELMLTPPANYTETRRRQIARYLTERRLATLLYATASAAIQPTWCRTSKGRDQVLKLTTQGLELLGHTAPPEATQAPQDATQVATDADAQASDQAAPGAASEASISITSREFAEHPISQANAASWDSGAKPKLAPGEHRAGTKIAIAIELLKAPEGATVAELGTRFGWLPHTTRAFITATVGKKGGHKIISAKEGERGRVYRIAA